MNKRCLIVGAGEPAPRGINASDYGLVIAADGGRRLLDGSGLSADLTVGDFDSLGFVPDGEVIRRPPEKDDTDMAIALAEGEARGYTKFVIYGGTGGRCDHTLANYAMIAAASRRGCEIYLVGDSMSATAVCCGSLLFPSYASGTVSVFAHGGEAFGVCLSGLKYPLDGATLTPDRPLGVSNSFIGSDAVISVSEGVLLVLWDNNGTPPLLPEHIATVG